MVATTGRTTVAAAYNLVWDVCSFLVINDHEVYAKLILVGIEKDRNRNIIDLWISTSNN